MNSSKRNNAKLLAAIVGGSAVMAMGALPMAIHHEQAGPDVTAKSTTMSIGATSTATAPPTVEATSMAVPSKKGPAPLPSEEKAAE